MIDPEEMIRHENAHSGLVFRDRAWSKGEHSPLLIDLIGLANASCAGPRYLVFGVDAESRQRGVTGVSREDIEELRSLLPRVAARLIEPPLKLELHEADFDGKRIAIVTVNGCNDPPYLLAQDLSQSMHAGRGWIRRGAESHSLLRSDLQRMFERSGPASERVAELAIGFPGKILSEETSLPALPLDEMPSKIAADRLQRMLEGNAQARAVLGQTETQFSRLLHAQVYGADQAFEKHTDDSLVGQLERVGEQYAVQDAHYEFEQRTHKLQLQISNNGEFDIERCSLTLSVVRLPGVGVADRLYAESEDRHYPLVDVAKQRFVIQAELSRLAAGSTRAVFRQPPRLWLREAAVGKTALIDYRLHCRELARPLAGSLRIHVCP